MSSDLQTCHQKWISQKKQNVTCCAVVMTTVLPLVPCYLKLKCLVFVLTKDHPLPTIHWQGQDNMGIMYVSRRTLCPTLKGCKLGYFVFDRKRLEPRVLSWQWHKGCHPVSFVMYISPAKFEEHCSSIFRDILDSAFYCFSETIYDVIAFIVCIIEIVNISKTKTNNPFFTIMCFWLGNVIPFSLLFSIFPPVSSLLWHLRSEIV